MKFFRNNLLFLMAVAAAALVSCSSDDDLTSSYTAEETYGDPVTVSITLSAQDESATRATTPVGSIVGTAGENMYSWMVVAVNSSGKVAAVAKDNCEDLTQVTFNMDLEAGTYTFYSFANLSSTELSTLGLSSLTKGDDMPDLSDDTFSISGNGFDITNHIPMSNKETDVQVTGSNNVTLYVVRMLAKIVLRMTNSTDSAIVVNSATLSDITQNPGSSDNIMVLPSSEIKTASGVVYYTSNLATSAVSADYEYTESKTIKANSTDSLVFYVNESKVTSTLGYFTLTLNTTDGEANKITNQRYGLLEWNVIARNDYRVIPITLDDYKVDIIPYDYSAIGVYPASVQEEDGVFTITFHAAGHFHLVPTVTKLSTGETLDYYATINVNENTSLGAAAEAGDTDQWTITSWKAGTITSGLFAESTDTYDQSDNGGAPYWDTYNEFFFGKFKEGVTGTAAYTLGVSVNKGGSITREYSYTVCLIREDASSSSKGTVFDTEEFYTRPIHD